MSVKIVGCIEAAGMKKDIPITDFYQRVVDYDKTVTTVTACKDECLGYAVFCQRANSVIEPKWRLFTHEGLLNIETQDIDYFEPDDVINIYKVADLQVKVFPVPASKLPGMFMDKMSVAEGVENNE